MASTTFSVDEPTYGCDIDPEDYSAICGRMTIRVRLRNRTVFNDEFLAPGDQDESWGDEIYKWRGCADAGLHQWSATLDTGQPSLERASGLFRVPRCRYPRYRTVPYGTAAKAAAGLAPGNEYVSDVRCGILNHRRGARAGGWFCGVRSNNTWRYCDRFFRIDFMYVAADDDRGIGGFGALERTYFWRSTGRECHAF